ncbi:MAG: GNAT family N-acetyltransferase [Puniceicoccales bacterium]|jgi:GrpB-like predicted nucleotidyltransferase (UPF0157 family)/GNAT superfamily N-acetyltransferase|nr:GNAT family N-acetyltransferase [Puniceicoccales bacterium]
MANAGKAPISIVPYDENWPALFETERSIIANALGDNCIAIHHIGSTAVLGLAAKPKIDIIAVAKDRTSAIGGLEVAGYVHRGEWNIPLKCGFSKMGTPDVNLHLFFDKNHPEIELNLLFRDHLRANRDCRDAYAALKMEILKDETSHQRVGKNAFPLYTLRKGTFIKAIAKELGFNRLRILKCTTDDEWNAVKILRQGTFFDKPGVADPHFWTFDHPEHEHFVLYHGVKIVGCAQIQFRAKTADALLRTIAITEESRGQGFGSEFLRNIEEWLKVHNYKILYVATVGRPIDFYKRHGYTEMPVDDPQLDPEDVTFGKVLI